MQERKSSAELGGNAGAIIDSSADLNIAVPKSFIRLFCLFGAGVHTYTKVFVHENILTNLLRLLLIKHLNLRLAHRLQAILIFLQ